MIWQVVVTVHTRGHNPGSCQSLRKTQAHPLAATSTPAPELCQPFFFLAPQKKSGQRYTPGYRSQAITYIHAYSCSIANSQATKSTLVPIQEVPVPYPEEAA